MRSGVLLAGLLVVLLVSISGVYFSSESSESSSNSSIRYSWTYLISDVPAGYPRYPSVDVGSDGTVWVAYMDGSDDKYVNVTWYDGSQWHYASIYHGYFNLVGSAAGAPPLALKVVSSTPHIFYYCNTTLDGYLNHTYYDGTSWNTETVWHGSLLSGDGFPANSLSVVYLNDKFYLLFQRINMNPSSPENGLYMISGTTGSWGTPVEVLRDDAHHWFFGDMEVYSSKIGISVYEEFTNGASGKIYYVKYVEFDGQSFGGVDNITSNTDDYMARLSFDSSGNPHIFYGKVIDSNGATYLVEQVRDSTGNWNEENVDTRENNPGGPVDAVLGANGDIMMAYNIDGQSGIQFSEKTSSGWSVEELDDSLSGNALRRTPSISFDSSGNIYVAYPNWNSESPDNYYIVVATTATAVPEFGDLAPILLPLSMLVMVAVSRFFHKKNL